MKLRIAAQLSGGFAVPIVALAAALAAFVIVFGHLQAQRADGTAKRALTRAVHEV
ncbi:MAG: hypothetical protein JO164_01975, partial [Candidatus Eremiobacteraeota bacterium]|nr:hypothetical protein [Candidatus Eremiobacteraeota bacterium]